MFSFRKIFKYLWIFVKPYKVAFFSLFLLFSFRIFFGLMLIPYGYKSIIDILNLTNVDIVIRSGVALSYVTPIIFCYLIALVSYRYMDFVNFRFNSRVIKDIYDFSFLKLSLHSYKFYSDNFSGSLVAKVKRLVRAFGVLKEELTRFYFILVLVVSSAVFLYFQSKILAFYLIAWFTIYLLFAMVFVRQKIKLDMDKALADSNITGVLSDSITNILNIKIFSAFKKEFNYFSKFSNLLKDKICVADKFTLFRAIFQTFFLVSFEVFILYITLNLWTKGSITMGVFVLSFAYVSSIVDRIWELSERITKFMEAMTDVQEVVDIFETEIGVKDIENPELCKIKDGVIEFKDMSFGYIEENLVFKDFNLKINKGEKVGLVGHSGSGKSTITRLLLRFSDVDGGEIIIDGQNIARIRQDDLRNTMAYVPQESILFHRTIKENIGYSKNNASDGEIEKVAKLAHADEFISKLPSGYDTLVGERGVKLSGGERQRVAIARAMLKNSPILILDEATSSLDSVSEHYIQSAFDELMRGKTTIVVAHRLSTIQKMNRIIVLEKGCIVEEGTHKELLEKKGMYASLWGHQTGGFLE